MEYIRTLNLLNLLNKKSFFLFGPRATGKTYLINQQLKEKAIIINLLDTSVYLRLLGQPGELIDIIEGNNNAEQKNIVVIDEFQKIPALLSEVHRLLDTTKYKFLLTGSSARKLKKENADMLAGRAWRADLFPLTSQEIKKMDLDRYLRFGGLPSVYNSKYPEEELKAYVDIYLKEEIQAEGAIRNLPPFTRFLKTAALTNGSLLNFTKIGNDSGVPASTVREYYSLLQDTMIGFLLEPWIMSKKRKAIQTAKFYFFDPGVVHTITGTNHVDRNSNLYGECFEQFLCMELKAYLSYYRKTGPLTFWRSTHGHEVDFLIDDHSAVEVKATKKVTEHDLKGLLALAEEKKFKNYFLVSHDKIATKKKNIYVIPWQLFLAKMWQQELF